MNKPMHKRCAWIFKNPQDDECLPKHAVPCLSATWISTNNFALSTGLVLKRSGETGKTYNIQEECENPSAMRTYSSVYTLKRLRNGSHYWSGRAPGVEEEKSIKDMALHMFTSRVSNRKGSIWCWHSESVLTTYVVQNWRSSLKQSSYFLAWDRCCSLPCRYGVRTHRSTPRTAAPGGPCGMACFRCQSLQDKSQACSGKTFLCLDPCASIPLSQISDPFGNFLRTTKFRKTE